MRKFRGDPCAPLRRRLEQLLRKNHVTPAQVERALRMSAGSLQYFVSGKIRTPDIVTVCLLARALNGGSLDGLVPVDEICALFDDETSAVARPVRRAAR